MLIDFSLHQHKSATLHFNIFSVIYRSCEKQPGSGAGAATTGANGVTGSGGVGGIAVPVVKSSSSWLHHLPTPSYDWHGTSTADAYSSSQRAIRPDMYPSAAVTDQGHMARGVIEAPKVGKHHSLASYPLFAHR